MCGQALILALVCLLALAGGLFVVFDTGQVVTKKKQLINAADAAAYSVGIEQARALNTAAYLNRAEVANQIAIAQMVSAMSYANYADDLTVRGAYALITLSVFLEETGVGEIMDMIAGYMLDFHESVMMTALPAMDKIETLGVNALNILNTTYAAVQEDVFYAFAVQAGLVTAGKVVTANTMDADGTSHATIPTAAAGLLTAQLTQFATNSGVLVASGNAGYTKRYEIPQPHGGAAHIIGVAGDWAGDRAADVMMQARDGFSAKRDSDNDLLVMLGLGWLRDMLPIDIAFPKRGSTDLIDYDRWVAVDSLGLHIEIGWCHGWIHVGCHKMTLPFAYGAAASLPQAMDYENPGIINPGIRLTRGSGEDPEDYHPGTGNGWDSPYDGWTHRNPYEGALGNLGFSAGEIAADPTDELLRDLTPAEVAWLPSKSNTVAHSGLQDYNDVAPDKAIEPYKASTQDSSDVGPIFTVFVQQPDNTVRTGANIGMEGGDLKLKDQGLGNAISAVSSAQVYYDRPMNLPFMQRADGQRELGNLYEPYWQVRLVATPTSYKVFLGIIKGL